MNNKKFIIILAIVAISAGAILGMKPDSEKQTTTQPDNTYQVTTDKGELAMEVTASIKEIESDLQADPDRFKSDLSIGNRIMDYNKHAMISKRAKSEPDTQSSARLMSQMIDSELPKLQAKELPYLRKAYIVHSDTAKMQQLKVQLSVSGDQNKTLTISTESLKDAEKFISLESERLNRYRFSQAMVVAGDTKKEVPLSNTPDTTAYETYK